MHACRGQKIALIVILQVLSTFGEFFFKRQILSAAWNFSSRLICLTREPQGSANLSPQLWDRKCTPPHLAFLSVGSGNETQLIVVAR